jgi:cysteine desulfurase family protein (TIGR01976 family)
LRSDDTGRAVADARALPALDPQALRRRFPALAAAGERTVFFDNAAGAQVPEEVFAAIREHLLDRNVQRGGRYEASRAVDRMIVDARAALGAFVGASTPEEIAFGLNATSLLRTLAEAIRPILRPGDEIVLTTLDHEANIGPWARLEAEGIVPRFWGVRQPDARLELSDLEALLRGGRVRVLALPLASNALGRIVDVAGAARLAHAAGALVCVDAVHFAPHGRIDVASLGADFLVFSGYKIFGPHVGFLWGRAESLGRIKPARDFFIPAEAPHAYEAGSQCYEAIAGMAGAMRYLASLDPGASIASAMERIRAHERTLSASLLAELARVPGLSVLGDVDPSRAEARVPTAAFRIEGVAPQRIVEELAARGIQARDGHMYAPRLLEALGVDPATGVVRVSLCHYNTPEEVARLGEALRTIR